ncbi:MAG TPA: class I SAM-dependent methyltransferase [Candidatus Dormibacteraeota bacterium]|nr:class I SAM-dependent methyltransferase [Candidatus Dormibacteraeota bacterium]
MTEYALRISDPEVRRYRMMAEVARTEESADWAQAGFVAGAIVADVGCGPAAVLAELAGIVGPGGSATGVERDPESADRAAELLAAAGHGDVRVLRAPAHATGIPAGSLDAVMLRHVLVHNAVDDEATGVPAILRHLAGLVRPGGHVYVVDTDLTARRVVPAEPTLDERSERYHALLRGRGCEPQIGPRLAALLRAAGLEVVRQDARFVSLGAAQLAGTTPPDEAAGEAMVAAGLATPEEIERWTAQRHRHIAAHPDICFWVPFFRAVGRRPV